MLAWLIAMGEDVGVVIEHEEFKSEFSILERSQVVVASLIPHDVPVQAEWHMRLPFEKGGTPQDIKRVGEDM